ncbi:MAG: MFS transporter [Desulfurococcus sp.]|uniref:MFS transporter n=1 Tax=Desulfurococcus sp. TaxID=51678 RepID=UPI003D108EB7
MRKTIVVFILLGLISLFADMTYEGALSIRGSYLEIIGAPIIVAGLINIGWLVSYGSRFLSGVLSDYLRKPIILWVLTVTGYLINVIVVPLLALTNRWELVLILIVLERFGKGLRAPARDVILAEVSEGIGKGLGFGVHETMDQAGAVLGPLLASLILVASNQDYPRVFLMLGVPGVIAVVLAIIAWSMYPQPSSLSTRKSMLGFKGLTRSYYMYTAGFFLFSLGFISWDIISYHAKNIGLRGDYIALLYSIAMLVDGLLAVPSGLLYDRIGMKSTILAPLASMAAGIAFTVFIDRNPLIMAFTWGLTMGVFETNIRVAVSDLVPAEKRAFAYGFYGLVEGLAMLVGGVIQSILIAENAILLAAYIVITEFSSLIVFCRI